MRTCGGDRGVREDGREIILNLPATIERATPCARGPDRRSCPATPHAPRRRRRHLGAPHNDRGTAVAAAGLLGIMASGPDRVEGICLLGTLGRKRAARATS